MKARLNITIEDSLLDQVKDYAASKHVSLSQIIEDYFKSIISSTAKKNNILEMVDNLKAPSGLDDDVDLKKSYYEQRSKKYGF
ncbi:DUF6364 family protein [Dyadobacter sp. MSC1_007]|jgi:hypothetical protein|uniref:DUF6364 family protein n=1 Tax=Dyadobacter sp. MSC1_007 TaxID=2909264 RepID=UPI002030D36B|nr:DUF6364 family protein [Dyadobacter sp. MSC1_007]